MADCASIFNHVDGFFHRFPEHTVAWDDYARNRLLLCGDWAFIIAVLWSGFGESKMMWSH